MKKWNYYCSLRGWLLILLMLMPALSVLAEQVTVADANGNELTYTFDAADGPATLTGIKSYSADEAKAGHIIIADRVTDAKGNGHDVLYIGGSVSNRSNVVSIVFGKNIIATGGPDGSKGDAFYNCSKLVSVTLNANLEIIGRYTFQSCRNLVSVDLTESKKLRKLMYRSFQNTAITDLTIPATVKEFDEDVFSSCDSVRTVTFLSDTVPNYFFRYHQKLESITVGANVKHIGNYAFSNNYYCRTLNINSGVSGLSIGEYAFAESDRLPSVTLPKGVRELGAGAFYSCDSLRTWTIDKDAPITNIPEYCFYNCYSLEQLTLPDAVQTVGVGAFQYCRSLRELTFGPQLTAFAEDWYIFYGCDNLRKVTLPGANYPFTSTGAFPANIVLFVHSDLVDVYRSNDFTKGYRIVAIGQPMEFSVTTAGGDLAQKVEAIGEPSNVMKLTVTGNINGTDIDYIHGYLPNLEELDLSEARIVEGGDSYHQWYVESNGTATIAEWYGPWNTENDVVGYAMFYNMPILQRLALPKGTKKIGDYAVAQESHDTYRLASVDIPAGVTEIGRYAFRRTAITKATVPAGVTRLEELTFYECKFLKNVSLPDGITFIGNRCFSENYALEDVNIPAKVETIDHYAFYNNYNRTTPIVLPATLKKIGSCAFMYNKVVKSITFNEGLETIHSHAFSNCNAVESIQLPESIVVLENNAFEGCDSITEFRFPQNIKEVPSAILYHCDKLQKVVLAEGTTSLGSDAFNNCPQLADINISDMNTLTSTGNYVFYNTGFTTMTLPNSITEMGYCPFYGCKNLTSVNVPTGMFWVPYDFCRDCPNLVNVQMHDGIRIIQHNAFYGCKSLKSIALNDQIASIEYNAFRDCDSLAISKLPPSLAFIGDAAFMNDKAITGNLVVPDSVVQIDANAFNGTNITSVTLPKSIEKWGTGLFANCSQLTSVSLPANIRRITNYMFEKCTALEQIQVPDSLMEVGYGAFENSGLASITLPDSLSVIESYAFRGTQLQEFRVPEGVHGDPGSYTWYQCKRLKSMYLGRNQDYSQLSSFTCLQSCDSLQLLRIYAGTPPKCDSWYMGYRTNCVLEVPEDAIAFYQEADVWKEFKEIRGFFDGDVLNDLDFAVLKSVYNKLDGANWKKPWDLSNNHRSMGKWQGVTTVGDYITEINLSGQDLKGELPDSLFRLPRLELLNLSDNHIRGDLSTVLQNVSANHTVTNVNLMGNELTGDIYPFLSKLPNITKLDVSYNRLTAMSQVFPNEKLQNGNFYRGFQFIDYKTHQVVDGAPAINIKAGVPTAIESNTLQTYRHEYGDYGFTFNSLARLQTRTNGGWDYYWELERSDDNLWNIYSGSGNYVLHPQKGVPTAYTHASPWFNYLTYILRFDWTDGDVNADQTVDVTDMQSVIYYAMNDAKVNGQMFNYSAADANNDDKINVSDVVGSVDYVLAYEETDASASVPYYNRAPAANANIIAVSGQQITMTNTDDVAALQLTVNGATSRQIRFSDAVRRDFSVAVRDVTDGVRIVIYSADGHTLPAGEYDLLSGIPSGAFVSDVRLSDSEARHLGVTVDGDITGIQSIDNSLQTIDNAVYDLNGRRLGNWQTLPSGIYIIRVNGKQYKVKK